MVPAVAEAIAHADECPRCSSCDFCPDGQRLMKAATKALAEALAPSPEILNPVAKA